NGVRKLLLFDLLELLLLHVDVAGGRFALHFQRALATRGGGRIGGLIDDGELALPRLEAPERPGRAGHDAEIGRAVDRAVRSDGDERRGGSRARAEMVQRAEVGSVLSYPEQ